MDQKTKSFAFVAAGAALYMFHHKVTKGTGLPIHGASKIAAGLLAFKGLEGLGYSEMVSAGLVLGGAIAYEAVKSKGHHVAGELSAAGWGPWGEHHEWDAAHNQPWEHEHFRRW